MSNEKIRIPGEAEKLFIQAEERLRRGEISSAFELLYNLTQQFPEFGKAFALLGKIYNQKFNDLESSEICLKKAISLSPEFSNSYLDYAEVLITKERFTETLATLNKVMEIPGVRKDKAFILYGMMNELQGRYDDAMAFYKKAILNSLSDEEIQSAEKAISRCLSKKKYTS